MTQPGDGGSAATSLPPPEAAALEHSRALTETIRAEMDAGGGRLPFRRYMELALYAPGLGYYSAGSGKIGPAGDFVTAPEISPLFSRCLARQCLEIMPGLERCTILEPGAGTGVMAADLLTELDSRGRLPDAYWILEPSAELRRRQEETLQARAPRYLDRIQWLDSLPAQPFEGIIVANEVLDAFPVDRIRFINGEILELYVIWNGERFDWQAQPAEEGLRDYVDQILDPGQFPDGYTTEVSRTVQPFIASLSDVLARGVMLLVDYGYPRAEYYHPQRDTGTMLCHYRHRVHADPFLYPGLQDITASVDFTTVAEAAGVAALEVGGFTTQAQFLLGGGLDRMLVDGTDESVRLQLAQQVKLLTLPGEMGERFKAIALTRHFEAPLAGFRLNDQRHRL